MDSDSSEVLKDSTAEEPSGAVAEPSDEGCYVIGIGASAGGLDAIERFFDKAPVDSGMAYVVVQHLSPDFKSLMHELLARHTSIPIKRVEEGMVIEPDQIYLIPPKKNMELSGRRFVLTDQDRGALNLPIDIFFRSMAKDIGERAIAVVLSGTGSDGTLGLQAIHDSGGFVLSQDLETAGFDGMPRSAASTEEVDAVCPPEAMPKLIARYAADPAGFQRDSDTESPLAEEGEGDRYDIFRLFRHKFGIDFSLYKPATIDRRIERRMQLSKITSLPRYIQLIEKDSRELDHLFRDLLVEVTQFFRDPDAFDRLRNEVVPDIVKNTPVDGEIRVWVPGCATGEEAYSLAMLFLAEVANSGKDIPVKVFATDVHRQSLEYASSGAFPAAAANHVPRDLRDRYLTENGDLCHVTRDLRRVVIFAPNDITRDPAFTKIDLISCRNLLIYLEPRVQKRVLSLFHFGLKRHGYLFLGASETLGDLAGEFDDIDRHWRIYRKQRDVRLPLAARVPLSSAMSRAALASPTNFVAGPTAKGPDKPIASAYEELLAKYVPPSLLVNEWFELLHSFGDARELLIQPEGRSTLEVLKLLHGDLRTAVSAGLHKARQGDTAVVYKGVRVGSGEEDRLYDVSVSPFARGADRMYLISMESVEAVPPIAPPDAEEFDPNEQNSEQIIALERELAFTRESLQTTVEELETSNEELQSTNEELVASNEELQSTNEELHSVNEELYSVNAEHKQKIDELTQLTTDMDNLMKSTEIGTVFLDRELRIRMFTPAIQSAFSVLDQDIGRPIDHIAYKLHDPDLGADIDKVLATGVSVEREVSGDDGHTYLQRIRAYREPGGRINGIVLTFTDITAVKEIEEAEARSRELLRATNDLQDFAYAVSHDLQTPLRHIKNACEELVDSIDADFDPEHLRIFNLIGASADSLTRMVQGLLAYSRVTTRGAAFATTECDHSLDAALDHHAVAIQECGAEIRREELPALKVDEQQVERLFRELIDNAIKYRDSRPLKIEIGAELIDTDWVLRVADNGIGIEERHLETIFVVFQRLRFKPEVPGDGIGLAVCKRIVERHRGRIWVESTPDKGSTFYFTLPGD